MTIGLHPHLGNAITSNFQYLEAKLPRRLAVAKISQHENIQIIITLSVGVRGVRGVRSPYSQRVWPEPQVCQVWVVVVKEVVGLNYPGYDKVNLIPVDKEFCDYSLQTAVLAIWSAGTASCKTCIPPSYEAKQNQIKQTMSPMLMQKSWKIIIQI